MYSRLTTVVTPPVLTQLTTLQTVIDDLGIDDADAQDQKTAAWLLRRIDRASAQIVTWLGREVRLASYQDVMTSNSTPDDIPGQKVLLGCYPVTTITSINSDGTALVAGTDYTLDPETGALTVVTPSIPAAGWFPEDWPGGPWQAGWWFGTLTVQYQAGYALPFDGKPPAGYPTRTLPQDLEDAAISIIGDAWSMRGRDRYLKSESSPKGDRTWWVPDDAGRSGIPDTTMAQLQGYRAVPV